MSTAVLFTVAKVWKQPKWPLAGERVKQLWDIYTVGYYSVLKRRKWYPLQQHGWSWRVLSYVK